MKKTLWDLNNYTRKMLVKKNKDVLAVCTLASNTVYNLLKKLSIQNHIYT